MAPSIFLTRSRDRSKEFINQLSTISKKITTKSLIDFSVVTFSSIPLSDWIFFYSQKGVKFFFDNIEKEGLRIGKNVKFAVFGNSTASFLESFVNSVDFVGTADAFATAKSFLEVASDQSVVFVKGTNSMDSLRPYLQEKMIYIDLVVYENRPKTNVELSYHDILVFTSPMNLTAYLMNSEILTDQTIFVIGTSTATTALQSDIESFRVPRTPSISALAECVEEYILSDH
ncbi:MAG: uroporphyrinogen-III synthase [Bacteroidia bacterium]|nr:uroporphyrinogen-III synthase [Bacteroidia bacterium]